MAGRSACHFPFEDFDMWNAKQIERIAELVERFCTADMNLKIDRRRYDREIINWAICHGLIRRDSDGVLSLAERSYMFDEMRSTPIEALWLIFRRRIMQDTDHTGQSIRYSKGWRYFNTYPDGSRFYEQRDYDEQVYIIKRLAAYGYLYFQSGGDVWDVWIKPEYQLKKTA